MNEQTPPPKVLMYKIKKTLLKNKLLRRCILVLQSAISKGAFKAECFQTPALFTCSISIPGKVP